MQCHWLSFSNGDQCPMYVPLAMRVSHFSGHDGLLLSQVHLRDRQNTLPVPASTFLLCAFRMHLARDSTLHEPTFNMLTPACHIHSGICRFQALSAIAS